MSGLDSNGNDTKYSFTLWRGKVTAILEMIQVEISKLATVEKVDSISCKVDTLEQKINTLIFEMSNLDKDMIKESTKNSHKWGIVTLLATLMLSFILNWILLKSKTG